MFEQQTPHRLIKHELLADSAGAGQWRGGLGVETIFEIGSDDTQLVTFGDGDFEGAFGLAGGPGRGAQLHPPALPRRADRRAAQQGPDHRRAARHGLPPGGQRRRRLGRPGASATASVLAEEVRNGVISPRGRAQATTASSPSGAGQRCMNFDLTDEQRAIRDTFARFCDERIAPQAAALDEAHAFPRAAVRRTGRARLLRHALPGGRRRQRRWADRVLRSRWPRSRAARCRSPARRRCSR